MSESLTFTSRNEEANERKWEMEKIHETLKTLLSFKRIIYSVHDQ